MAATAYQIKLCKEILSQIDQHIPARGYTEQVKEVLKSKGLKVPSNRKIYAVRQGKEYDLNIVNALAKISMPMDEEGNLLPPKTYQDSGIQTNVFEPVK